MLKLYFSTSPSFYESGYNLKLIVGQKLWLLTLIGFMTRLHLWYGTVARMTLPPTPGQSPLWISSNPGSVRAQSGQCANLCLRSPWKWVVIKKRDTHLQLVSMPFTSYRSVFPAADLAAFRPCPWDSVGALSLYHIPYFISLMLVLFQSWTMIVRATEEYDLANFTSLWLFSHF